MAKDNWEELSNYQKEPYIQRAKFLVENGYSEEDEFTLAEKIYRSSGAEKD